MELCIIPTLWTAAILCFVIGICVIIGRIFSLGGGEERRWFAAAVVLVGAAVLVRFVLCALPHL